MLACEPGCLTLLVMLSRSCDSAATVWNSQCQSRLELEKYDTEQSQVIILLAILTSYYHVTINVHQEFPFRMMVHYRVVLTRPHIHSTLNATASR
jgi:hypothetical protein